MAFQGVTSLTVSDEAPRSCSYAEGIEGRQDEPGGPVLVEDGGFSLDRDLERTDLVARTFLLGDEPAAARPSATLFVRQVSDDVDWYRVYGLEPGTLGSCNDRRTVHFLLEFDHEACEVTVTVRIRLNPDAGVTLSDDKRDEWRRAIRGAWSRRCKLVRTSGLAPCAEYTIVAGVTWVDDPDGEPDIVVRVSDGDGRDNTNRWYLGSPNIVAAHEFGHYLGNIDEYDGSCDGCHLRPVRPGIMNDQDRWRHPYPYHFFEVRKFAADSLCSDFVTEYLEEPEVGVAGGGTTWEDLVDAGESIAKWWCWHHIEIRVAGF